MANPYLKIQDRQAEIMRKAASDLGFTPTCRTRIHMPGGGKSVGKQNAFANNGRRPD
jgi:phage terminase small subunit